MEPFHIRQMKFAKEVDALQEKYHITLVVAMTDASEKQIPTIEA